MLGFNSFEIGLLILLGSFCAFTIVGRICTCIETCARAKADLYEALAKIDTERMEIIEDGRK